MNQLNRWLRVWEALRWANESTNLLGTTSITLGRATHKRRQKHKTTFFIHFPNITVDNVI